MFTFNNNTDTNNNNNNRNHNHDHGRHVADDEELDRLFAEIEKKTGLIQLTHGQLHTSVDLKFAEMLTTQLWIKIDESTKIGLAENNIVLTLERLVTSTMEIGEHQRKALVGAFYLRCIMELGIFTELYMLELLENSNTKTKDTYFVCSANVNRINLDTILIGNFVFRIVNPTKIWTKDNVETKRRAADDVGKREKVMMEILTEKVVLVNFFFDTAKVHISQPLYKLDL